MTPPRLGKPAIVGLAILALVAYVASRMFLGTLDRRISVSSLTDSGRGLSLFYRLAAERGGERIAAAYLTPKLLKGVDTLVVSSPLSEFSSHEADMIARFVDGGGTLILTFHDLPSHDRVKSLMQAVGQDLKVAKNKAFEDFKTETVSGKSAKDLAVYSPVVFDDDQCEEDRLACFFRAETRGDGKVLLMAGLPLMANALINRGANADFAARLLAKGGTFAFDEYHHYFSAKTFADLLLEPTFTLPLVGLAAVLLLYLAFGDDVLRLNDDAARPLAQRARSYQDLNKGFLLGALGDEKRRAAAVTKQAALLRRRFPSETIDLPGRSAGAAAGAAELLRRHREILKTRGRG